ncbi:zinc finger protein 600-like [Penaeus japonicus]|uniref:zinc finger protein 600-like n=1 Tax=Penaeus japonicus TaxID=27405 RepID=UPI001C71181F|nr:zinc finger protein 600-like [Penaeus japonicus]
MSLTTAEESYLCTVCGKKFRRKSCLKMHSRVHSVEKSCFCLMCAEPNRLNGGPSKQRHNIKKMPHAQLSNRKSVSANGKSIFTNEKASFSSGKKVSGKKSSLAADKLGLARNKADTTQNKHASENTVCLSSNKKPTTSNARSVSVSRKSVLVSEKSLSSNRNPSSSSGKLISVRGKPLSPAGKPVPSRSKPVSANGKSVPSSRKITSESERNITYKNAVIPNGNFILDDTLDSNSLLLNFRYSFKWFCTKSAYNSFQKVNNQFVANLNNKTKKDNLNNKIFECKETQKNIIKEKSSDNQYKCRICGKYCGCNSSLKDHMIVHLDEKLYNGLKCWKVKLEKLKI